MSEPTPVRLRPGRLFGWVMLAGLVGLVAGTWPTWRLAGADGLVGMAVGAGAAVVGLAVGLKVLWPGARKGPLPLAMRFMAAWPLRLVLSMGLAGLAYGFKIGSGPAVLLWTASWMVLLLAAEAAWLTLAIRENG